MNTRITQTPLMATVQFGLSGHSNYSNFIGKKARARREEKRQDKKQEKEEKKQEKQEKRELNNEKKRLKNDMRAALIEEKRSQTTALNNQVQSLSQAPAPGPSEPPIPPPAAKKDNTMLYVGIGVVGLMVIGGIGWTMYRKNNPGTVPYSAYGAGYPTTLNPIKP